MSRKKPTKLLKITYINLQFAIYLFLRRLQRELLRNKWRVIKPLKKTCFRAISNHFVPCSADHLDVMFDDDSWIDAYGWESSYCPDFLWGVTMKPIISLSVFNGISSVEGSGWNLIIRDRCYGVNSYRGAVLKIQMWNNGNLVFSQTTRPPTPSPSFAPSISTPSPTTFLPPCTEKSSGTLPFYFSSNYGVFCREFAVTPQNG